MTSKEKKAKKKRKKEAFPKFLMKINGERKFLSFRETYVAYDSDLISVEFGRYVLNADFSVRKMTKEDEKKIIEAADKYGEGK